MAKSLNKVMLIGNLGKDVETKLLPNGDAVCNFSIACSESWKDKNTGEKVEKTEWINVVAFRKLAEICDKWLSKGSKVYVEGKYQTRKWTDKDNNDRWSTEVLIHDMQMLGGKQMDQDNQSQNAPASQAQAAPAPAADNSFDDDIPF